jgi:hypothetical protein
MCRQKLRNEVPEAGNPLYLAIRGSCGKRPNPARLSDILFSFHFGFFRCTEDHRWRLAVPGQRPATRTGPRTLRLGIEAFWTRRTIAAAAIFRRRRAERGGSAQACRRPAEIAPERAGTAAEERAAEQAEEASAQSLQRAHGQRSDCASSVLEHACGGDELERHGHAEYAAALGLSPMLCAYGVIAWKNPATKWTADPCFIRVPRAQLSSVANCARRKYRLTPQAVDGRSNRRRSSDEQKRAIVQETEKRGVSRGAGLPPQWSRHQPAFPLAGRLWPDRSKGAATGNGGARRRRGE